MGVPKFYRWISERYPLINHPLENGQVTPYIDNLYLDMNGIIHNCVHSGDSNDTGSTSPVVAQQKMFLRIFKYIDQLCILVRPQKLLFLAIDGVAPRAKMNQQRSRRFRSGKERTELAQENARRRIEEKALQDGWIKRKRNNSNNQVQNDIQVEYEKELENSSFSNGTVAFDSNCITPGTEFMHDLSLALRFFVEKKISEDSAWKNLNVIFSGAEVPGEGEHKIMEYIRHCKTQKKWQPNLRHCMYGLDADLIMLALVTHEPHFLLIREKVDFSAGFRKRKGGGPMKEMSILDTVQSGQFELLSIGLLREYIQTEYQSLDLPFFDLERIIDDFIFICFLVGNDFLPHAPFLDIREGAMELILKLYKHLLPRFGGYLTDSGSINFNRLEILLSKIGMLEMHIAELRKSGKKKGGAQANVLNDDDHAQLWGFEDIGIGGNDDDEDLADEMLNSLENLDLADNEPKKFQQKQESITIIPTEPTDPLPKTPIISWEEADIARELETAQSQSKNENAAKMKRAYYKAKLEFDVLDVEAHRNLRKSFLEGLIWTLDYYYKGCKSWRWFYPYHYAPMASDMVGLLEISKEIKLEKGKPFLPQQQLLSVLPPSSAWCLPKPYRDLMERSDSPLIEFYPVDFKVDMNDKKNDWEAVVLLPFVDENKLMEVVNSIDPSLFTEKELSRNQLKNASMYTRSNFPVGSSTSPFPNFIPNLQKSYAKSEPIHFEEDPNLNEVFLPVLYPGTTFPHQDPKLSDLPTLNNLVHTSHMSKIEINIFGTKSRYASSVIDVKGVRLEGENVDSTPLVYASAKDVVAAGIAPGTRVIVHYPWKADAIVVNIRDSYNIFSTEFANGKMKASVLPNKPDQHNNELLQCCSTLIESRGLDTQISNVLICVVMAEKLDPASRRPLSYSKDRKLFPAEIVLKKPVSEAVVSERAKLQPGDSVIVFKPGRLFGQKGEVLKFLGLPKGFLIGIEASNDDINFPKFAQELAKAETSQKMYNVHEICELCGLSSSVVGRLTSSVRISHPEKLKEEFELGLGIKFLKRDLVVPGYARKIRDNLVLYTEDAKDLLVQYKNQFPEICDLLHWLDSETTDRPAVIDWQKLFPGEKEQKRKCLELLATVQEWIRGTEVSKLPLMPTSAILLSRKTIMKIEEETKKQQEMKGSRTSKSGESNHKKYCQTTVCPFSSLLRPGSEQTPIPAIRPLLGDRVVNIKSTGPIPFGLGGYVVGIHPPSSNASSGDNTKTPMQIEVVFDEGFVGGGTLNGRCSESHGKVVGADTLLHLGMVGNMSKQPNVEGQTPNAWGKAPKAEGKAPVILARGSEVPKVETKAPEASSLPMPSFLWKR